MREDVSKVHIIESLEAAAVVVISRIMAGIGSRSQAAAKLMKSAFEALLSPEAKGFDRVLAKV